MTNLERIRVPVLLIMLLTLCAIFLTPSYPVHVLRTREWSCAPSTRCHEYANYTEMDPAIIVASSGFSWFTRTPLSDGEIKYSYETSPSIIAFHFLLTVGILMALTLKAREKADPWLVNLRRRYWRAFLWAIGFYFLVLSVFWAWGYLIFYGFNESIASVDPLLVSTVCTFLLSGLGLAMMMLSVRSRAIWPTPFKEL